MENSLESFVSFLEDRNVYGVGDIIHIEADDLYDLFTSYASLVRPETNIVLPSEDFGRQFMSHEDVARTAGWNDCLAEIKRLNPSKNSEG